MTKPASMEGTREEGRGWIKVCKSMLSIPFCLSFCFLLHYRVNPCDGEFYLLVAYKVRKERLNVCMNAG